MNSQSHIEIQQGLDTEFKKHDLRFKMRSFRMFFLIYYIYYIAYIHLYIFIRSTSLTFFIVYVLFF